LLDVKSTKRQCIEHVASLRRHLQAHGRLREARRLIYLEVHLLEDADEARQELESFLKLIADSKFSVERAMTLVDLGNFQLKSEDPAVHSMANQTFTTAEGLFRDLSHRYGSIDVSLMRIDHDRSLGQGEKFLLHVDHARRYFAVGNYQNGIRTLAFAVTPQLALDVYADEVASALTILDEKINEVGGELLKQASILHSINHATLKGREFGFALHALESYLSSPPAETGPIYRSGFASMLSTTYINLGRLDKAVEMAEEALKIAQIYKSYDTASTAATLLAHTRSQLAHEIAPKNPADAKTVRMAALELLKDWVGKDSQQGYAEGEFQKCLLIVELYAENGDGPEQPWIDRARHLVPDTATFLQRKELLSLQMRIFQRRGQYSESLSISLDYVQAALQGTTPPAVRAEAYLSASIQGYLRAMTNIHQGGSQQDFSATLGMLKSSLQAADRALKIYQEIVGSVDLALYSAVQMWRIMDMLMLTLPDDATRQTIVANFLGEVLVPIEKSCDEMRRSVLPIHGLDSLMNKRHLVSRRVNLELYSLGTALAAHLGDNAVTWMWLQKGKARAFLDSLGFKATIPHRVTEALRDDEDACRLLRVENDLLELQQDPRTDQVLTARRLVEVRKAMTGHPLLAEVAGARDAMLTIESDLPELRRALTQTAIAPEKVKFVDWLIHSTRWAHGVLPAEISLLVRTMDGETTVHPLSLSVKEIEEWISLAFTFPEGAVPPLGKKTGNRLLQRMQGLVDGLAIHTSIGDMLVVSPTGPLNRVPIHALEVEKTPLVERNMVVYASTAAILCSAVQRWAEGACREAPVAKGRAFMAVYEDPTMMAERQAIFTHVEDLANSWDGAKVVVGPSVTKETFGDVCSQSSWLHYHGHARYGKDDICASSLVLSDGVDLCASGSNSPQFLGADDDGATIGISELTVRDIFSLKMPPGAVHSTIIACDSGTQDVAPGNEPLGIIQALLYAGSTSVIGCLWPIDSRAGRTFSQAFNQHLLEQKQQQPTGRCRGPDDPAFGLNLALALQSTIGKMRKGELGAQFKQAYYWAPFVLHGLWFFG